MGDPVVFISYSRTDGTDYAVRVQNALIGHQVGVWRDDRDLYQDQDFTAQIENAIQAATHVVVCVTPGALREDGFVRREVQYALIIRKPIIPLHFGSVAPIISISTILWIDCNNEWNQAVEALLRRLRQPEQHRRLEDVARGYTPPDPFRSYVEDLYQGLLQDIRDSVLSTQLIPLRSRYTPDAVSQRVVPTIYRSARRARWSLSGSETVPAEHIAGLSPESIEEFATFRQAFAHYQGRVLLLGEPGAGKTTTLLAFARECAVERLENPQARLPLYVPIHLWDGHTPPARWLAEGSPHLENEIYAGRTLLILDGLDELPDNVRDPNHPEAEPRDYRIDFLRALTEIPEHTPMLVSCRVKDYDDIIRKGDQKIALNGAVTLNPLTDEQIQAYLESDGALWEVLQQDAGLLAMCRTPLILTLLLFAFREYQSQRSSTPETVDFDRMSPDDIMAWLESLAKRQGASEGLITASDYSIPEIDPTTVTIDEPGYVPSETYVSKSQRDLYAEKAARQVSSPTSSEKSAGNINWRSRIFQVYVEMRYRFEHERDNANLTFSLDELYDCFGRVTLLALGDAFQTEERDIDLSYFRRVLGEKTEAFLELAGRLHLIVASREGMVRFIHLLLRDHFALTYCEQGIRSNSKDDTFLRYAPEVLVKIEDERAEELLTQMLRSVSPDVQREVVMAMGRRGGKKSVNTLLGLLVRTKDSRLRTVAAESLGRIGDKDAIPLLIRLLYEDPDRWVKRGAAWALGRIGDPSAIPALIDALRSGYSDDESSGMEGKPTDGH